jgi:SAM-dependent MidA family methyltransferase
MTEKAITTTSPEFIAAFRQEAGAGGLMSFARFMNLALYHPEAGYYARPQRRIGRAEDTDFFTAASLGPMFGELVVAACVGLLGPRPPGAHAFVEIGAEPDGPGPAAPGGVLAGVSHPFAGVVSIPLGQPLVFPPQSLVFSNELFDAQPFHRIVREADCWRETGVALRHDSLEEVLLPELSPEVRAVENRLPPVAPDGYRIDLPLAAARLTARIAAQPWSGLFVAFDYGKPWRELAEDTPGGTLRAYFRHRQHGDLLARAGGQDLTGHVCWDWLADALVDHGFATPVLESQEAFFVHHAAPALNRLIADEAGRFSGRKLGVMQLLHPANMGRKFQVLHALRDRVP